MPEPQSWCSLPWCGKAYGGPMHSRSFRVGTRTRVVKGETVTVDVLKRYVYPSMIDMHDIKTRSQGGDPLDLNNNAPVCHTCHMAHHGGTDRIEIRNDEEHGWQVRRLNEGEDAIWRNLSLDNGMGEA